MELKYNINYIYTIMNYCWGVLFGLQYLVVVISCKSYRAENDIKAVHKSRSSRESIIDAQPFMFIFLYNILIMFIYIITKKAYFITVGMPFGGLLLYLSKAGDNSHLLFVNEHESNGEYIVDSVVMKNLIKVALISVYIFSTMKFRFAKPLQECSYYWALVEILILLITSYYWLDILIMSMYIILGIVKWDDKCYCRTRIKKLKCENISLKKNLGDYADKLDNRMDKMSLKKRILLFVPNASIMACIILINYIRQLIRNIRILFLSIVCTLLVYMRGFLEKRRFIISKRNISRVSTVVVLISTYIWLTLVWGPDYVVTKIIYAFSTIIIIPIVVNKLTSDNK